MQKYKKIIEMVIVLQPFSDIFYKISTYKSLNKVADQKKNRARYFKAASS